MAHDEGKKQFWNAAPVLKHPKITNNGKYGRDLGQRFKYLKRNWENCSPKWWGVPEIYRESNPYHFFVADMKKMVALLTEEEEEMVERATGQGRTPTEIADEIRAPFYFVKWYVARYILSQAEWQPAKPDEPVVDRLRRLNEAVVREMEIRLAVKNKRAKIGLEELARISRDLQLNIQRNLEGQGDTHGLKMTVVSKIPQKDKKAG